jgi:hypothetical protein
MPERCKGKAEKSPLSIYLIDELLSMARTGAVGKLWPEVYLVVNPSVTFSQPPKKLANHPLRYVAVPCKEERSLARRGQQKL